MPAYVQPWMLWLGSLTNPERSFLREVLSTVDRARYTRLVEPAAGMLAVSLLARELGWPAAGIEASDVMLVPALVGVAAARSTLDLDVRVDGEPAVTVGETVEARCAELLMRFLLVRNEYQYEKAPSEYLAGVLAELRTGQNGHIAEFTETLQALSKSLAGIDFRPRCLFEHTFDALDDEHALILLNPPTIKNGYEKMFATGARVTWDEPTFAMFDPVEGVRELLTRAEGAPGLLVVMTETKAAALDERQVVYARYLGNGRYIYYLSNRPDEVRDLVGVKVGGRSAGQLERPRREPMPSDHQITADSSIDVIAISAPEAAYLKELWTHRPASASTSMNFAVVVDGYLACAGGFSPDTMVHPHNGVTKFRDAILLTWAFSAAHASRLSRLILKVSLQRRTLELLASPKTSIHVAAAARILTVDEARLPESKSKRGLMDLVERRTDPKRKGCFRLFYAAPLEAGTWADALAWWIADEARYGRATSGVTTGRRRKKETAA